MATKKALAAATAALAAMSDCYHNARQLRLEADREAAKLKKVEDGLFANILAEMKKQGLTKVVGQFVQVVPDQTPKSTIESWAEFCQFLVKTREFDLLEKRLSKVAVAERVAAGKTIPGVKTELVDTLSITKA